MTELSEKKAWVTLVTNDQYGFGALVLCRSLRHVQTAHSIVVMVTPQISADLRGKLSEVFDEVVEVALMDSEDSSSLSLLKRPELGVTFTKLHCWSLVHYAKCVFIDADCLVLRNCDELFDRQELSAAPDAGWPDSFNSGLFVFVPSDLTHSRLVQFATQHGSYDGADQGVLNEFFSDWSTSDISRHLPFVYNTTINTIYTYLPAFRRFASDIRIVHFIGAQKPWLSSSQDYENLSESPWQLIDNSESSDDSSGSRRCLQGTSAFYQYWWQLYHKYYSHTPHIQNASEELSRVMQEIKQAGVGSDEERQRAWEAATYDYTGVDSFDSVLARIKQTLQASQHAR